MDINPYLLQRYNVLKVFIYGTLIVCFIFAPINFMQERVVLGIIDVFVFVVNLITLLNFQKIIQSKYRETFVFSYSILLLVAFVLLFWGGSVENLSYMYLVLIPVIGYLTNSFKNGFRLTSFFMTLSVGIYIYNTQIKSGSTNYVQVFNVIVLVLDVWLVIHMYEKIRLNITNKLIKLATIDPLTKLKNRTQFYQRYRSYKEMTVCLILLDIDGLKNINEKYGHLDGDVVLMSVATILQKLESKRTQIFRMGNDEFAVLIAEANYEDCVLIAQNISNEIRDCKIVPKHDVISVTASIAMTCTESDSYTADQLMANADRLLKQAKEAGTNKIAIA